MDGQVNWGQVSNNLVDLEIARGNIIGFKGHTIPGRKNNIGISNLEDITQTGNTVLPRPAGTNIEIISSSVNDDVTGTGVRTVEIEYLSSNGNEARITLTMDGTTAVNIGTAVHDIQWIHAVSLGAGVNGVAAGDIKIRDVATGAIIYEQINAGGNQSLSARYKVPNGKTAYIMGWHASAATQKIDFRLRADVDRQTRVIQSGVFLFQDAMVLEQTSSGFIPFVVPLKCPQLSTIKVSAISFTVGGDAGAQFEIILINN